VEFGVGQSGAGQVFSEFFGFPCNRRSLHQLFHNHPGKMYNRPNVWPQYWDLYELRGPAKGPKGVKSHPTKKKLS
jgi:hypothetical protein